MNDTNLIMDRIRKELKKGLPSKKKILSSLLDLLKRDKSKDLNSRELLSLKISTIFSDLLSKEGSLLE